MTTVLPFPSSLGTTGSHYVSFISKKSQHPAYLQIHIPSCRPCDNPLSTETGNGAERRDTQHETGTKPLWHTHLRGSTAGKPSLFSNVSPQRCFSASLSIDYSAHIRYSSFYRLKKKKKKAENASRVWKYFQALSALLAVNVHNVPFNKILYWLVLISRVSFLQ